MPSKQLQEARKKLFNSDEYKGPTKTIEYAGVELEIRPPRLRMAFEDGEVKDQTEAVLLECVFLAETGEPFFDKTDLEDLKNEAGLYQGSILNRVSDAVAELTQENQEDEDEEGDEGN